MASPLGVAELVSSVGGIGEFVSRIRSLFGKAGDFATRNNFEYGQIYNALLQYSVLNAYIERENHQLLVEQASHQDAFHEMQQTHALIQNITLISLLIISLVSLYFGIIQARRLRPLPPLRRSRRNNIYEDV